MTKKCALTYHYTFQVQVEGYESDIPFVLFHMQGGLEEGGRERASYHFAKIIIKSITIGLTYSTVAV